MATSPAQPPVVSRKRRIGLRKVDGESHAEELPQIGVPAGPTAPADPPARLGVGAGFLPCLGNRGERIA